MHLLIHQGQKKIQISNINSSNRDPPQKDYKYVHNHDSSSCGSNTMKIKREIHQATSTNPYSRGGLLPPHHGDEVLDLGGVEISPWAAMEESSPPMVADSGLISVFLIYAPPPSRDVSETFIYGGFRSREPP